MLASVMKVAACCVASTAGALAAAADYKSPGMAKFQREASNPVRGVDEALQFTRQGTYVRDGKVRGEYIYIVKKSVNFQPHLVN